MTSRWPLLGAGRARGEIASGGGWSVRTPAAVGVECMPFHAGAARSVPSPVVRIRGRQVCGPPLGALLQVLVAVELGQQSLLTPQLGVVGVAVELFVELPCGGFGVAGHLRGPGPGGRSEEHTSELQSLM